MLFALAIVRADYVPRIVLEIFFNNGRRLSSLEITIGWSSVMTSERIFIFGFCDRCWTVEEENVRSSIRERYHYLQRFFLFTQKQCSQSQTYTVVDTHFSTHPHRHADRYSYDTNTFYAHSDVLKYTLCSRGVGANACVSTHTWRQHVCMQTRSHMHVQTRIHA